MKNFYPMPQQIDGLKFLLTRHYGALFFPPGLGKTAVMLALFEVLREQGLLNRVLIISTPAIIRGVWGQQIRLWGCDFKWLQVTGMSPDERFSALHKAFDYDIVGINFEIITRCFDNLGFRDYCKGALLVVDESEYLSNHATKSFDRLRRNLHYFPRRYVLSGTPRGEGPMKLWSQMYLLDFGESLEPRIGLFRDKYFYKHENGHTWVPKKKTEKKILKKIKHMVLYHDRTHLELPEKKIVDLYFDLPSSDKPHYYELEKDFVTWLGEQKEEIIADTAAAKSQKLRQLVSGLVYTKDGRVVPTHKEKENLLLQLLDSLTDYSVLLVYEYTSERDRLLDLLSNKKPELFVSGSKQTKLEKEWNNGSIRLMLTHAASTGHGLNLQHAPNSVICWYTTTWSANKFEQLNDRLWRIGRKYPVFIYRLLCRNTIDTRRVIPKLNEKLQNQEKFLKKLKR